MNAYVFSIGEPTTDICVWSLERAGFKAILFHDQTTLAEKLARLYTETNQDFLRVDADVIPNKRVGELPSKATPDDWWLQGQIFDWYKMDIGYGGIQYVKQEALDYLRQAITQHMTSDRPESQMYRLEAFHSPRRCRSVDGIIGIHGAYQKDLPRVIDTKQGRKHFYDHDFKLVGKLQEL